jgi:hypothetical protein
MRSFSDDPSENNLLDSQGMNEILNNLYWIEELLPPGLESIPKHGGMAYFMDQKMVLILVEERDGTNEHKGVVYPFEIWNGAIFPIEYKKQSAFFLKYSFLENHPANRDWLYIPANTDSFEEEVRQMIREINKHNPLLGTPVKFKAPPKQKDLQTEKVQRMPKAVKASKKRENSFILGMVNRSKRK